MKPKLQIALILLCLVGASVTAAPTKITVDPKYDTPKHLQKFVSFFNKDFIGLSGSQH